ncbi:MAG: glycosyltransferase [Bacteroidales bacterium]|nr:glycosyltransferase [Clostridium sp.]MCM1202937.1 glycosyltransferase [Bacteroidales bacterium]
MKDVSVIVPVYNAEKYLRECVESIIGQTLQNIEIIFVDDGSVDGSLAILKEYAEKDGRIRVVNGSHGGGGAARNIGIEAASGEYLSFFDSDDVMEPELLEKTYYQCKKTDADVGVFSVRFWHEATGAVTDEVCGLRVENLPPEEVFSYRDMPKYIFNSFHNWPWNKMFKHSFVKEHKLRFQEIKRTNDLLFTTKALIFAERITTVQEYLTKYRVRLTESCQASNGAAPFDFYQAFFALKEFLTEEGIYEEVRQSFVNHALDGCIANLNTSDFSDVHKQIFIRLKEEIFEKLDILGHDDEYFYPMNIESKNLERFHYIMERDYEGFLLYRANELNDLFHERLYLGYHDWQRILGFERQVAELTGERDRVTEERDRITGERDYLAGELERVNRELTEEVNRYRGMYEDIRDSFSYRFGYKVTVPVRAVGRVVRKPFNRSQENGQQEDDYGEITDGNRTDL